MSHEDLSMSGRNGNLSHGSPNSRLSNRTQKLEKNPQGQTSIHSECFDTARTNKKTGVATSILTAL